MEITMGLDIGLATDNYHEIFDEYVNQNNLHLSRTFCNFIFRKSAGISQPELDQIGEITRLEISIIYDLMGHVNEDDIKFFLENAETKEIRDNILREAKEFMQKLEGNIDKVTQTINQLIEKLSKIENLTELLLQTDVDTLNNSEYFSNFNTENKGSYTSNNFGDDLRAFQRFLYFAKERGAKTVWFEYG